MWFASAATGMFVFGIVMAVLGTLFGLPEMRTRLQIDLAQQGNLFFLLYVGIFLATLVAGPAIDDRTSVAGILRAASIVRCAPAAAVRPAEPCRRALRTGLADVRALGKRTVAAHRCDREPARY